ncbi:MAG: flagellar protein FlaG [Alphaproteobacteria bacterium]
MMLSLVVTPQETRPIERADAGSDATAREEHEDRAVISAAARERTRQKAPDLPVRAPDDPAHARLGRNLNMVFDQKSGRPIIEIINPRTGEVMDRIPPESLLDRARKSELPARASLFDETA